MNPHPYPPRKRKRPGGILVDVIVSAILVLAIVSLLTTMTFRASRTWQRLRHEQLALDEVSNHLERLTSLPAGERRRQITNLDVSPIANDTLRDATIGASIVPMDLGEQVVVTLTWTGPATRRSVQLTGWALEPVAGATQ